MFVVRNVNGITFVGSVKEKTVARNLYAQAKARGKAAGIVRYYPQCTRAISHTGLIQILYSVINFPELSLNFYMYISD